MGQRGERWLDRMIAAAYRKVVESYMRYVLLRCSEFTNSREAAKEIAVGMLAAICAMMPEVDGLRQVGQLVDCMIDGIGVGLTEEDLLAGQGEELFADEWLAKVAKAANGIDGFGRQVIVLYHMERFDVEEIGMVVGKSVEEIEASISTAERKLIENLAEGLGAEVVLCTWPIRGWFGQLGQALEVTEKDEMVRMVCGCMRSMEEDMAWLGKYGFCKSLN